MEENDKFSRFERQVITDYLERLVQVRDAKNFAQGLLQIKKTFGKWDLPGIETILRSFPNEIHLIAAPITEISDCEALAPKPGLCTEMDKESKLPYYLWVGVNGSQEADGRMKQLGINYQENLQRLSQAGLLVAKPGSSIARQSKATSN
jgi:hypothetical protein